MHAIPKTLVAFGACVIIFSLAEYALAQRARKVNSPALQTNQAEAPSVVGKVVAYQPERSIAIETTTRSGPQRREFNIAKDKTKIELPPRVREIAVGATLAVWADKDDPDVAARIGVANTRPAGMRQRNARPANTPPVRSESNPPAANPIESAPSKPLRPPVAGLDPQAVAYEIDRCIQERLDAEKIPASPVCDDAEFIRRVYLDIAGVIPPAQRVREFLDDRRPDKRARLIDELLASPQYGLHFAQTWSDRIVSRELAIETAPFAAWLAERMNEGRGWDEVVFDLLTAGGSFNMTGRGKRMASADPRAFFVLVNTEGSNAVPAEPRPQWLAAESARLFLGVQLQCAECHDHPFTESWKQTDFWGMAAFFSQLRIERGTELAWSEAPLPADQPAEIAIPATALKSVGTIVPARLLGEDKQYRPSQPALLRQSLAKWITSPENAYFAKAAVNHTWARIFGRGLVEPVDDLRPDNPASHPVILDMLAGEFERAQFDERHLIRCLCLSQTYQRTSAPTTENEHDDLHYSHMAIKALDSGVLYDSLQAATGWPELLVGLPLRKTKAQVITGFTPREVFEDFFRASQGQKSDPLEYAHGLPQALKLMNAAQLNRVAPTVERLLQAGQGRDEIVEQLYLTALARRPTAEEAAFTAEFLDRRKESSREDAYNAVLWALTNSSEFVLNH
jgi:hypothetical protein